MFWLTGPPLKTEIFKELLEEGDLYRYSLSPDDDTDFSYPLKFILLPSQFALIQ